MILRAATPYVPQHRLSVPTPRNNFHLRRGMGDPTPGCPINSLDSGLSTWAQQVIAFPSSLAGEDPSTAAREMADQYCAESQAGVPFGCPLMSGCDAASRAAIAQRYAAQINGSSRYQDIQTYGAYAPPPVTSVPQTTSAAPGTVSVAIQNVTRPGSNSQFTVGDSWRLVVTGPPNVAVSANQSKNGTALGGAAMGSTNSTGQLVLSGTFNDPGNFVQQWQIGGGSASLSFTVSAVSAPAQQPAPQAQIPATQSNGTSQATAGAGASQSNGFNQISVMPDLSSVPSWVIWGFGGLLAFSLVKGMVK